MAKAIKKKPREEPSVLPPIWIVVGVDVQREATVLITLGRSKTEALKNILETIEEVEKEIETSIDHYNTFSLMDPSQAPLMRKWLLHCGISSDEIQYVGESLIQEVARLLVKSKKRR